MAISNIRPSDSSVSAAKAGDELLATNHSLLLQYLLASDAQYILSLVDSDQPQTPRKPAHLRDAQPEDVPDAASVNAITPWDPKNLTPEQAAIEAMGLIARLAMSNWQNAADKADRDSIISRLQQLIDSGLLDKVDTTAVDSNKQPVPDIYKTYAKQALASYAKADYTTFVNWWVVKTKDSKGAEINGPIGQLVDDLIAWINKDPKIIFGPKSGDDGTFMYSVLAFLLSYSTKKTAQMVDLGEKVFGFSSLFQPTGVPIAMQDAAAYLMILLLTEPQFHFDKATRDAIVSDIDIYTKGWGPRTPHEDELIQKLHKLEEDPSACMDDDIVNAESIWEAFAQQR
jgi:hypothetical protein